MTVLDASAVLALIHDEPGGEIVAAEIADSLISTVNMAEVVGTLVDAGLDGSRLRQLLGAAGVTIEPLSAADASILSSW